MLAATHEPWVQSSWLVHSQGVLHAARLYSRHGQDAVTPTTGYGTSCAVSTLLRRAAYAEDRVWTHAHRGYSRGVDEEEG